MIAKQRTLSNINIGKVIYHALVFKPPREGDLTVNPDELTESVSRLWQLLRERDIDHVLVGGVALLQYIDGRNTEDIDLIMAASALDKLPEIQIAERNPYFAFGSFNNLRIDILLTRNPLFAKVQRKYTATREFIGQTITCATVEGLILLKLYALPSLYRSGDFARVGIYENDVATLIQYYHPELSPLLAELKSQLNESDMNEILGIVADIQRRISRFEQKNSPDHPDHREDL
jgi:hypothetical protein